MEKKQDVILFGCAIIGAVADLIAIVVTMIASSTALSLLSTVLSGLIFCAFMYLYFEYKDRCEFLEFIEYLFENSRHNFNLLPKICLALDKSKEVNKLHLREMNVTYTFDMQEIDTAELLPDTSIEYSDTIEYNFRAENKNIPKEFVCYRGNMKADNPIIRQKHGCQMEYEDVTLPPYTNETRVASIVQRYCWQLKRENITNGKEFPLSFQFTYSERARANSDDTIIFYPRQYAKSIEVVKFKIDFLCDKQVLKKVELFKIWKDGKGFKNTPIPFLSTPIKGNNVSVSIHPDTNQYEAYYFKIYWELAENAS